MIKLLTTSVVLLGLTIFNSSAAPGHAPSEKKQMQMMQETDAKVDTQTHNCSMHPHIKGDNCPICGMHLTPQKDRSYNDETHEGFGSYPDESSEY